MSVTWVWIGKSNGLPSAGILLPQIISRLQWPTNVWVCIQPECLKSFLHVFRFLSVSSGLCRRAACWARWHDPPASRDGSIIDGIAFFYNISSFICLKGEWSERETESLWDGKPSTRHWSTTIRPIDGAWMSLLWIVSKTWINSKRSKLSKQDLY